MDSLTLHKMAQLCREGGRWGNPPPPKFLVVEKFCSCWKICIKNDILGLKTPILGKFKGRMKSSALSEFCSSLSENLWHTAQYMFSYSALICLLHWCSSREIFFCNRNMHKTLKISDFQSFQRRRFQLIV